MSSVSLMDHRESPYAIMQLMQRIHQVYRHNLNPDKAETFTNILFNLGFAIVPQTRLCLQDDDLELKYFGFLIRHNGMTRPSLPITSNTPDDLESFLCQLILVFKDPNFLSSSEHHYIFGRKEFVPSFLLFNLYINPLMDQIRTVPKVDPILFADDITLLATGNTAKDCVATTQQAVNQVVTWSEANGMPLAPAKTRAILLTPSTDPNQRKG